MYIEIPEKVKQILNTLEEAGFPAYVVGGCVRDSVLGRKPKDWDITTKALPQDVKKLFRRTIDTGIEHGTVTIMLGKEGYEVTTYRIDGAYEDSRRPKEVTFTEDLKEDLRRRDFTINAMAYNPKEGLVDVFEGIMDSKKKVIRAVGDPRERFGEDALRMMRALRFSAQLGYRIEKETEQAIFEMATDLSKISAERIQMELIKLLESSHPETIKEGYLLGITKVILPEFDELIYAGEQGAQVIKAMKVVPSDKVYRLAILFGEMGEEKANEICRRLKMDNATRKMVAKIVKYQDYELDVDSISIRKAIFEVGEDVYPYLYHVQRARIMTGLQRDRDWAKLEQSKIKYEDIIKRGDCLSLQKLKIDGKDLIELGLKPGKEIGKTLYALLDMVLEDQDLNTRERLLAEAKKIIEEKN
jgi:tRNA nucleotidyltransferase (CCA-adding enzyme)